jgi:galactose mutarotase-like enzyme
VIQTEKVLLEGFSAYRVSNGILSFEIIPELFGKLTSLRDLRSSREWLWRSERQTLRKLPYGNSYIAEADSGGWDECFPTVAPCFYPGEPRVALPDHGELWTAASTFDLKADDQSLEVTTRARGTFLNYLFSRTIYVKDSSDTLTFKYTLENHADTPLFYIWSAHPMIRLEPGMRLRVSEKARFARSFAVADTEVKGETVAWPPRVYKHGQIVDVDPLPGPEAKVGFKMLSEPLEQGWAELEAKDGSLRYIFAEQPLQLALWFNLGAWSGDGGSPYYNLAFEPCLGWQDSLQEAVEKHGCHHTLPASEQHAWSLNVQLISAT